MSNDTEPPEEEEVEEEEEEEEEEEREEATADYDLDGNEVIDGQIHNNDGSTYDVGDC